MPESKSTTPTIDQTLETLFAHELQIAPARPDSVQIVVNRAQQKLAAQATQRRRIVWLAGALGLLAIILLALPALPALGSWLQGQAQAFTDNANLVSSIINQPWMLAGGVALAGLWTIWLPDNEY